MHLTTLHVLHDPANLPALALHLSDAVAGRDLLYCGKGLHYPLELSIGVVSRGDRRRKDRLRWRGG